MNKRKKSSKPANSPRFSTFKLVIGLGCSFMSEDGGDIQIWVAIGAGKCEQGRLHIVRFKYKSFHRSVKLIFRSGLGEWVRGGIVGRTLKPSIKVLNGYSGSRLIFDCGRARARHIGSWHRRLAWIAALSLWGSSQVWLWSMCTILVGVEGSELDWLHWISTSTNKGYRNIEIKSYNIHHCFHQCWGLCSDTWYCYCKDRLDKGIEICNKDHFCWVWLTFRIQYTPYYSEGWFGCWGKTFWVIYAI